MSYFPDDVKIQRLDPDIQYNGFGPIVKMLKDDKGDYVEYSACCQAVQDAGWPDCPVCWGSLEMEKDGDAWFMQCTCGYKSHRYPSSKVAFQNAKVPQEEIRESE